MALTKISRGLLNTGVSDSSDATAITIDSSENVLIGTTSGSDPLVVSDSGASSVTARFINTNADANPANIRLQKLSGSPADNDYIGMINVSGENDASEETIFQSIDFISTDVSDGTEDGDIVLRTRGGGTLAERLRITGSGSINVANSMSFASNHFTFTNSIIGTYSNNYMYVYGGSAGLIMGDNYDGSNRILLRDSNTIEFETNGSERMRISSGGNLAVGTTTATHRLEVLSTLANYASGRVTNNTGSGSTEYGFISQLNGDPNNTTNYLYLGGSPSTTRFVVYSNGNVANTNNSYGAYSDVKLKENIVDANPQLEKIKQLQVRNFNLKTEPDKKLIGLVAQEAELIFPKLIDETEDTENNENGAIVKTGETTKSIKYSVFVPVLIKAIQELSTKLEAAEARITTLEG